MGELSPPEADYHTLPVPLDTTRHNFDAIID